MIDGWLQSNDKNNGFHVTVHKRHDVEASKLTFNEARCSILEPQFKNARWHAFIKPLTAHFSPHALSQMMTLLNKDVRTDESKYPVRLVCLYKVLPTSFENASDKDFVSLITMSPAPSVSFIGGLTWQLTDVRALCHLTLALARTIALTVALALTIALS